MPKIRYFGVVSKTADFGRILAASVIFYYHVGKLTHYPYFEVGEYAVGFFVILSGVAYTAFSQTKVNSPSDY